MAFHVCRTGLFNKTLLGQTAQVIGKDLEGWWCGLIWSTRLAIHWSGWKKTWNTCWTVWQTKFCFNSTLRNLSKMEAGGTAPPIYNSTNLLTRQNFTVLLLYPSGTNPQYPLKSRRMGKCQSWSICCGEKSRAPPRNWTPDHPACSQVTTVTMLSQSFLITKQ
jgi:hypothetical protein